MQFPQNNIWDSLEHHSLIPTMCQNRAWLTAMFDHLGKDNVARLIGATDRQILALAALEPHTVLPGLQIPVAATWDAGLLFSGTPLISASNPLAGLENLLVDARETLGARAVLFKKVQVSDEFTRLLETMSQNRIAGYAVFNRHKRAGLIANTSFDVWFKENFSRKRRKEYRRLRNRLKDRGNLETHSWSPGDPVASWIDEFLALEKAGWKGRRGTAIACDSAKVAHICQSLSAMAQDGSLLFWKIVLDGKVIASIFGFKQNQQIWLGKMAYDETLAAYSPGVLLILDVTRDILDNHSVSLADSSAAPDHPMINNIWRDRIDTADYMIACPGTSPGMFRLLVGLEAGRLALRSRVKAVYHKLRKGKK